MKHLNISLTYGLSLLAVWAITFGCKRLDGAKMQLCNHPYALCTSARCIPQPGNPKKAICFCDVEQGLSMATAPCKELEPSINTQGIQTIYSTFSFKQYAEGKRVMKCPGGTPWSWCLNQRCTVDPADSTKAVCLCDVVRSSEEWITFGGSCDLSTCQTAYWSGAGLATFAQGNDFMVQSLNLTQSPIKWCPSQ